MNRPSVLAIDGGGTRCRVAYCAGDTRRVVETGSANVSTDLDGSLSEIRKGLGQLASDLMIDPHTLYDRPAFVGLAGVVSAELADHVRRGLPLTHAMVTDDRPAALRGALGPDDGVLAHCGTGSFFGAQLHGATTLVGGWGPVLGDEASAQWIGRAALAATLDTVDGMRPSTDLTAALLSQFDGAAGIVAFAATSAPSDLAALAPSVTAADEAGDAIAQNLMSAGARHITQTVKTLGWQPGRTLCLTGGIGRFFQRHLAQDLQADIAAPKGTPLDGAISLACDLSREPVA